MATPGDFYIPARMSGHLYIVSTPIGNLGDMTFRAVEILRSVSLILAEDTRHSRVLLDRYEITTPLQSYHEHNEAQMTPRVLARLQNGEEIALITDAGTPLLSDPGERLVTRLVEEGIPVVPIPGASALLAALVGSGLPSAPLTFFGFLPRRGHERGDTLRMLSELPHTGVFYEAPSRVSGTLNDLVRAGCAERRVVVARELTKQYEEFRRGTVGELAQYYETVSLKGEVVVLLEGKADAPAKPEEMVAAAQALRAAGKTTREVQLALQADFGAPRNLAYRLAHET
jgi:16S rRNA (cytidine1402-2'-O)-methyltransferase